MRTHYQLFERLAGYEGFSFARRYVRNAGYLVAGVLIGIAALWLMVRPSMSQMETLLEEAEEQIAEERALARRIRSLEQETARRRAQEWQYLELTQDLQTRIDSLKDHYGWIIYRQDRQIGRLERFISRNYEIRVLPPAPLRGEDLPEGLHDR